MDPDLSGEPGHFQVEFSNITGGWPGIGNIRSNPRFESVVQSRFELLAGSPCIDAGDNSLVTPDYNDIDADGWFAEPMPYDLIGDLRFRDDPLTPDTGAGAPPVTDMGCFEYRL